MRKHKLGDRHLYFALFCTILFTCNALSAIADSTNLTKIKYKYDPIRTIVIDAGHGGKDTGCVGADVKEKDVALDVALRLGQKIMESDNKIKVIFTRTDDTFIPLFERTAIANRNHADLFISIHCNASSNSSASGSETFVMGLHRSKENLEIAKRENNVVLLEDDYQVNYGGYDPNSPEGHIILSTYQNHYLNNSITLAERIERSISKTGQRVSRGVKQAGFVVLRTATMPSILIETGFLTNSTEEQLLSTPTGRDDMAESIFQGLSQYIDSQIDSYNEQNLPEVVVSQPKPKDIAPTKTYAVIDNVNAKVKAQVPAPTKNTISYSVQIAALKTKVSIEQLTQVVGLDIRILKDGNIYKYLSGVFSDLPKAYEHRQKLLDLGLQGVFIFKIDPEKHKFIEKS